MSTSNNKTDPTNPQLQQAFSNLSDRTKECDRKLMPIIFQNVDSKFKEKENRINELKIKNIKTEDIDNCVYTSAGNIMIYCNKISTYNHMLNDTFTMFNVKPVESYSANDYRAVVIYGLSYEDAKQNEDHLKSLNIIDLEEIKSIKKEKSINMVKAICNTSITAKNLISSKIKIGYERYKVAEFTRKKKLIVCYDCSKFGHKRGSNKCNGIQCYGCGSKDHTRFNCPDKDDRSKDKCPNCNGNHPATYAGCSVFKNQLNKMYGNNKQTKNKVPLKNSTSNNEVDLNKFNYTNKSTSNKSLDDIYEEIKKTNENFNKLNFSLQEKISNSFNKVETRIKKIEDRSVHFNNVMIKFVIKNFYMLAEKLITNKNLLNNYKTTFGEIFSKHFVAHKEGENPEHYMIRANKDIEKSQFLGSNIFFKIDENNSDQNPIPLDSMFNDLNNPNDHNDNTNYFDE